MLTNHTLKMKSPVKETTCVPSSSKMYDDPYGSLIKQCQPTSSQQDCFLTCSFAGENEVFPEGNSPWQESNETPVELTGIIMVSLPDSSKDDSSPREDFQTPPEESLLASSEEQRTTTAVDDALAGRKINGVNGSLERDSGDEAMAVDHGCTDTERTIDLGKNSNNLGFSGVKLTQRIGADDGVSSVDCSCGFDGGACVNDFSEEESKKCMTWQGESNERVSFESQLKKLKVTEKNCASKSPNVCIGNNEPVLAETNCNENAGNEVLESEFEEIGQDLGPGKDTVNVGLELTETEEGAGLGKADEVSKNGDDAGSVRKNSENFKYVASGWQAKDVGEESGLDTSTAKRQLLKDLLESLKLVAGELDVDDGTEDVDFLETAKKCGITFPRPRWWPPEGFDD